jgi:perosamine synthetase
MSSTISTSSTELPWFLPEMTGAEIGRLTGVLNRNFLNDGPLTREFEGQIAARVGVPYAVAVTSGTAALALALMAKEIGPGDEIIVPDLTFVATANAARLTGGTVVLADVERDRFALAPEAVESLITTRTRAVVPVDVNGRGANYRWLEPFCRNRGLALICDAAEAFGSKYDGRPLGSFGDAACFSFSANKTITTGQGGMIVTADERLYHRLLELKDQGRRQRGTGGDDLHPVMGFNFKFTDLQAAVGLAQLEVVDQRLQHAQRRDRWYREALDGLSGVMFPDTASEVGEVRQWTDVLIGRRDDVRRELDSRNIGMRAFWFPLHRQAPYFTDVRFPHADHVSDRGIWLPSHFRLAEDDVGRVAEAIRDVVGNAQARVAPTLGAHPAQMAM